MKITAQIVPWDDLAEADFKKRGVVPDGDPTIGPDHYAEEIKSGRVDLVRVFADGEPIGHVGLFLEHWPNGKEMVIQAAVGALAGVNLTGKVLPLLEDYARSCGCMSVRFHTSRIGLILKAEPLGYEKAETIMRKVL